MRKNCKKFVKIFYTVHLPHCGTGVDKTPPPRLQSSCAAAALAPAYSRPRGRKSSSENAGKSGGQSRLGREMRTARKGVVARNGGLRVKIAALVLFFVTYVLLLALPKFRSYIAAFVGVLFLCLNILPWQEFATAIDWNVLMIIAGTMGIVALFIESKMPALLADLLISRMPNVKWAIIALSLFAGLVSAFVDNVATVLMIAPIALSLSKKLDISPVPGIIAIAVASNLQGAATLVGDTTSIMLGSATGMSFIDFFVMDGKMGMFWIVQIAALAATVYLLFVFRKDKQKIEYTERTEVKDFFPSFLLIAMLALLIGTSFVADKPDVTPGIICVGLMVVGMIYTVIRRKDFSGVKNTLKEIDFKTLLLLAGIFLIIGGLDSVGIIDDIADILVKASGGNIFALYSLLVWASVLVSAFIDNIPYVATMLPVIAGIATGMGLGAGESMVLYLGLLSGATLGGNLTPIGASANITATGILRKEGYEVKTLQYMKISVPFTLIAVLVGYGLVWLVYS